MRLPYSVHRAGFSTGCQNAVSTRNDLSAYCFSLTNGIDVLNRSGSSESLSDTVHVMKYVFPKQFGLRNVFNSSGNTFSMKDFTSREDEITKREIQQQAKAQNSKRSNTHKQGNPGQSPRVPKRLRGKPVELVRLLQTRQRHCSYWQLLQYYCPLEVCRHSWHDMSI